MTVSNVFSASSLSMSNGGRIVKVTLWPVSLSNSAAMAFAAICVDPTLRTRTLAAVASVDETMSVSVLTAIVRKDGRMMSSRNSAVVTARESTPERGAIRYSITSSAMACSLNYAFRACDHFRPLWRAAGTVKGIVSATQELFGCGGHYLSALADKTQSQE